MLDATRRAAGCCGVRIRAGYPVAMKRYHVTTFGCQMNEHDSERMKGMLESLGYAEAHERHEADLILFNTCSIRESADSRFIAHLGEAKRLKRERPERDRGRGRLLGAVAEGGGVRALPVRGRGVRPRPGAQARGVPDERLAHRAGLLRVRGLHRAPAGAPRAPVPGLGADQRRLQLRVLVLHRAVHARARGQPPAGGAGERGPGDGRGRRQGGDAAGAERQLLRPRPARADAASPSCWGRSTGSRASSASATRARIRRTCART